MTEKWNNFSFYIGNSSRVKDIIRKWVESGPKGNCSLKLQRAAILLDMYPDHIQELLDRGLENLTDEKFAVVMKFRDRLDNELRAYMKREQECATMSTT